MSRRDELVGQLDQTLNMVRASISNALPAPSPSSTSSTLASTTRRILTDVLDLPPPSSSTPPRRLTPTPLALSPSLESRVDLPPATSQGVDGDALPPYSRQAAAPAAPVIPQRIHTYASKRLKLSVVASGDHHPVLIQTGEDSGNRVEKMYLGGSLRLELEAPETITHLRVRLKAIIRTMVLKIHGSGRHPVSQEVQIWEDAATLYSTTTSTVLPAGNLSSDPLKLQGTFEFPFKLHLPSRVARIPEELPADGTPLRSTWLTLPPSFVLSGEANGGARGSEWASCRYFLKVTLGRKGLLKSNERLIVPIIYLPRGREPRTSPLRTLALSQGRTPPGPLEDPSGWAGKKVKHTVKRGVFTAKKGWFEAVLLLPAPASFQRLSSIPFAIKLTSSDPQTTGRFPIGSISILFVQRAGVSAQGLHSQHDTVVGRGSVTEDGPAEGSRIESEGVDGPTWGKRYKGTIKLDHGVGSSFRAPNLSLSFLVALHISVSGVGNDADLLIPVDIVSATRNSFPNRLRRPAAAIAPVVPEENDDLVLPPSYFEVMET